jgi:hypothetical protein
MKSSNLSNIDYISEHSHFDTLLGEFFPICVLVIFTCIVLKLTIATILAYKIPKK